MNFKKTPSVDINDALVRILLMLVIILIGVLISTAAEAGVRGGEKNVYHKVIQKKKSHSYSCEELKERQRGSSNIVVKKSRRPKWR